MKTSYKILICAGTALITALSAAYSHLLLMPLIALGAYMAAEWGFIYLVPVLAGLFTVLIPGEPTAGAFATLAELLAIPLILAFGAKKKLPHRYVLLALAVVVCVGEYLSLTLDSMIAGKPPYEGAVELWNSGVVAPFEETLGGLPNGQDAVDSLREFASVLPDILMWACVLCGEAISLALVLLLRLWHRVFRTEPQKMADITLWRLPKSVIPGSILMGACIAAVYIFKLPNANAVAYSLGLMIASLFSVQGLSYLLFVFRFAKASKLIPALAIAFIVISLPWSGALLGVMGFTEQLRNRRALMLRFLEERKARGEMERMADEYAKYGYIREEFTGDPDPRDDDNKDDPVKED